MTTISTERLLAAIAEQPHEGTTGSIPRITNAAGPRASIYLYDVVSKWTAVNAQDFQRQLSAIKAKDIDVHINSPGGSVFEGLAIYNLLRAHPAKVTVHVDGLAASVASVIALAGDEIEITEGAQFMIHDASVATSGNARQLRKDAELVEQISQSITDIYVSRTGRPRADIRKEMEAETWFTADAAVTAKFATRVVRAPRAAAQWKPEDHPQLPAVARALANAAPPSLPKTHSMRDMSAEIDRLRSENLALQQQLTTTTKPATPAPTKPTTPTMITTTPAKPVPTKFASTAFASVMKTALDAKAPTPDREAAVAELTARGYDASIEGGVTMDRRVYGMISAEGRQAFSAAGGKIFDPMNNKPDFSHLHGLERARAFMEWEAKFKQSTATEASASAELTFPRATLRPRSAEEFLAMNEVQVANVGLECEDERNGKTLRQELFDAKERAQAEWKPGAKVSTVEFQEKFRVAFRAIYKFGPKEPTWINPPPPVAGNAMDAAGWLALSPSQVQAIWTTLTIPTNGRNSRAELKRAYIAASPAEKIALRGVYDYVLQKVQPLEVI